MPLPPSQLVRQTSEARLLVAQSPIRPPGEHCPTEVHQADPSSDPYAEVTRLVSALIDYFPLTGPRTTFYVPRSGAWLEMTPAYFAATTRTVAAVTPKEEVETRFFSTPQGRSDYVSLFNILELKDFVGDAPQQLKQIVERVIRTGSPMSLVAVESVLLTLEKFAAARFASPDQWQFNAGISMQFDEWNTNRDQRHLPEILFFMRTANLFLRGEVPKKIWQEELRFYRVELEKDYQVSSRRDRLIDWLYGGRLPLRLRAR